MSLMKIKDLFHFEKGGLQSSKCTPGEFDFITAAAEWKTHNEFSHECEALIFAAAASGSLGRTHYVNGKFVSSDLCFIITPKDPVKYPIDLKFYHLIFQAFKDEIVRNTKAGTSKEAIGLTAFGKYELPYFDIAKQQEVKEQFVTAQESTIGLDSELTHQLDLVKQLRQAFLREAMQGQLVQQEPNEEPASVLLEKIKTEKERLIEEKKIKKQKPLPPITEEEIPFEIPENWVWCRLGELSNDLLGGFAFKSSKYVKESKNQVIRLGNVKNDNLLLNANPAFVTDDYASIAEKARLLPGDILVTMTGTRAKRDYLFTLLLNDEHFENFNLYLNQRVGAFRLNDLLKKEFITFLLKEPSILEPVFLSSTGAANQANIGVTALNNILVPLPPLSEQQRIVAKLDELMGYCDELEASIKESQQQNEQLLQQVLREALEPKEKEVTG